MEINICVSVNSAYVRYLQVMLTSVFENDEANNISVYVMHKELHELDINNLKALVKKWNQAIYFTKVDESIFEGLPVTEQYKVEVYFRLMMPYLLPRKLKRILHLDVDIIVRDSLEKLYSTELSNEQYMAVCIDTTWMSLDLHRQKLFGRYDDVRYFNSGVMLWDLAKIREKYSIDDFKVAAAKINYDMPLPDQDLLNFMFFDKVKYISPEKYNCFVRNRHHVDAVAEENDLCADNVILHFTGTPPWRIGKKSKLYKVWWDYAKLTPGYSALLREQLERIEEYANRIEDIEYERDLWKNAYHIKDTNKVLDHISESEYTYYLYGAGRMAERFFGKIIANDKFGKIKGVIDITKEGEFGYLNISNDISIVDNDVNMCVVITPMKDIYYLKAKIKKRLPLAKVITLAEFLAECNAQSS